MTLGPNSHQRVTILGGGLVGALLATGLAKQGRKVVVYEKRSDLRKRDVSRIIGEGRSINLAISVRGIHTLKRLGLDTKVLRHAIPMPGRRLHTPDGKVLFQPYGTKPEHAIHSISRSWLNGFLLDEAEKAGAEIVFDHPISHVDLHAKQLILNWGGKEQKIGYEMLFGTDGAGSVLRKALEKQDACRSTSEELSHGYLEFLMPARRSEVSGDDASFAMDKSGLHIWPRGDQMLIALPNFDGSFTCTWFLSHGLFESLQEDRRGRVPAVQELFAKQFQDFPGLVPDYCEQFERNPYGKMVTVKSAPWYDQSRSAVLLGDAAHAIVPFFGQGMNCGFEDVDALLDREIQSQDRTWIEDWFQDRKPNTDAIADMAVENFQEMAAQTASQHFLFQKQVEREIQERFSYLYVSKYSLVSFSRTPYRVAKEVGVLQKEFLDEITRGKKDIHDMNWEAVERQIRTHPGFITIMKEIV